MEGKTAKLLDVGMLAFFSLLAAFFPGLIVMGAVIWAYSGLSALLPSILPKELGDFTLVYLGIWVGQLMAYGYAKVNPFPIFVDKNPADDLDALVVRAGFQALGRSKR